MPRGYLDHHLDRVLQKKNDFDYDDRRAMISTSKTPRTLHTDTLVVRLRPNVLSKSLMAVSIPPRLIIKRRRKASNKQHTNPITEPTKCEPDCNNALPGCDKVPSLLKHRQNRKACRRECDKHNYTLTQRVHENSEIGTGQTKASTTPSALPVVPGIQIQQKLDNLARRWSSRSQSRRERKMQDRNEILEVGTTTADIHQEYDHLHEETLFKTLINQPEVCNKSPSGSIHNSLEEIKCPGDSNKTDCEDNRNGGQNTHSLSALEQGNPNCSASKIKCQTEESKLNQVNDPIDAFETKELEQYEQTGDEGAEDAGRSPCDSDTFLNSEETILCALEKRLDETQEKGNSDRWDFEKQFIANNSVYVQGAKQHMDVNIDNNIILQVASCDDNYTDVKDDECSNHQDMSKLKGDRGSSSEEKAHPFTKQTDNRGSRYSYEDNIHAGWTPGEASLKTHPEDAQTKVVTKDLKGDAILVSPHNNADNNSVDDERHHIVEQADVTAKSVHKSLETRPASVMKKEGTFEKQNCRNAVVCLKADPANKAGEHRSLLGKTPNYLQNALHGNETKRKNSTSTSQANVHANATSDLHCNAPSRESTHNYKINPVTKKSQSQQITFEGSYSCRLLRKERNVGTKVHRELKKREKETGGLKVLAVTGKYDENRTSSRESAVSRLSSKIRSRRNSVVDFFQRRLSIDKIAAKVARAQSSTKVTMLTEESQKHAHNSADNSLRGFHKSIPTAQNESPCSVKESFEHSTISSQAESCSKEGGDVPEFLPGVHHCNTTAGVTKVNISGVTSISEQQQDPTSTEGATYDILQYSSVKKKIDELKKLKKSRRKTQALGTTTIDIDAKHLDDADISAEKTYKKSVPAIKKFGMKGPQRSIHRQDKVNPECKVSSPASRGFDKYSSSECVFETVDTHSSRISTALSSAKLSKASHRKLPQTPASIFTMTRGTTPLYPSIMNELDCRNKVVWMDEVGNLCEVESTEGKYGQISCLSAESTKTVKHRTISPDFKPDGKKIPSISSSRGNEDPLSPEVVRKKKEALAQIWSGLPHTSHDMKHQHSSIVPEHCIIYADGFGTNVRIKPHKSMTEKHV